MRLETIFDRRTDTLVKRLQHQKLKKEKMIDGLSDHSNKNDAKLLLVNLEKMGHQNIKSYIDDHKNLWEFISHKNYRLFWLTKVFITLTGIIMT